MSHRTAPQGTATATVWTLATIALAIAVGLLVGWHAITDDWGTTAHTLAGASIMAGIAADVLHMGGYGRRLIRLHRAERRVAKILAGVTVAEWRQVASESKSGAAA